MKHFLEVMDELNSPDASASWSANSAATTAAIASGLQQTNDEFRQRLEEAATETQPTQPIQRVIKEQHGVINGIRRRLLAV